MGVGSELGWWKRGEYKRDLDTEREVASPAPRPTRLVWYEGMGYGVWGMRFCNVHDLVALCSGILLSITLSCVHAMAPLFFSVASVVEDVLQQHGPRLKDLDFESRKAEETASRRYEAAGWLRKMVGVVAAKDLPAEPSEEEFRLGLRSGIILCNVINKVQSGAVPKVVESPIGSALIPDGAPLTAYQYFENVRNFLVAVQEIGLPTFEASDLEQGGKSSRVVNCVLALKSYSEWKMSGANGVWKFGGNLKPTVSSKTFVRKNSDPFTNSLSRTSSINDKFLTALNSDVENNQMSGSHSLSTLVRAILSDKKPEEVPMLVESVLNKVVEEFEQRIASQGEQLCIL
ncbi:hypothetical protein VNO78_18088 [Psophocarpus tetragonolobus]|uniref:Calponin-homology (CH) domain-containing protein n=1 Tax=Psophocarpus tetragonolobus TaxID=3891 RepID=A0AAN9SKA1_PSOTE